MSKISDVPVFSLHWGKIPLLLSIPHLGTRIPTNIAATMSDVAAYNDDCDWHLDRLYAFAKRLGASIITPSYARYVIDLNRPPNGQNLYPGQDTTGLVPLDTFDKKSLYRAGQLPTEREINSRRDTYWQPYHNAIVDHLADLKKKHGAVLLWDAHSIRSQVPRLFDGSLPDFNFGTAGGDSAMAGLADEMVKIVLQYGGYSAVANGRFRGGYITRQYGRPREGVHALQLELSQRTYMEEQRPYAYDEGTAGEIEPLLELLVERAVKLVCSTRNQA